MIRDDGVPDAKDYKSRLYHIYEHVRDDLNRDAQEHDPLPDLVINGYYLLGKDWLETEKAWVERGFNTPPVMISVANRTETAARVKFAFDHKKIRMDEPVRKLSRKEKAELLRQKVDTVGQSGKPGEPTKRSQINFCVFDSTWEASEAFELDRNPVVEAWVKNDHLGFEILYIFKGEVRKYRPDFIVRLKNGKSVNSWMSG